MRHLLGIDRMGVGLLENTRLEEFVAHKFQPVSLVVAHGFDQAEGATSGDLGCTLEQYPTPEVHLAGDLLDGRRVGERRELPGH